MKWNVRKFKCGDVVVKKRFAWLPTLIESRDDRDVYIWFSSYYEKVTYGPYEEIIGHRVSLSKELL